MHVFSMIVRQFGVNGAWYNNPDYGPRLQQISSDMLNEWFALHDLLPETLYHYTTAEGLLGIFNSNRLWATQADYLNDSSELNYARDRIRILLANQTTKWSDPAITELLTIAQRVIGSGPRTFHVACFCENGDLLSQWRGYGNDGGYAIGFSVRELGYKMNPTPPYALRKVIYDQSRQDELISTLIEKTLETFRNLTFGCPPDDVIRIRALVLSMFEDFVDQYTICFKDPLFQEEHEWRIVESPWVFDSDGYVSRLRFRRIPGGFAPYVELDLSPSAGASHGKIPISSITHGPTLSPPLAKASPQQLLRKYDYPFARVQGSRIPLRF